MPVHSRRIWCVSEIDSAEELAEMLAERTWTCCSAFSIAGHPGYLFLNDAFTDDGAQEYAVVKRVDPGFRQIETITFSWCSRSKARDLIEETVAGSFDDSDFGHPVTVRFQTLREHRYCPMCA